MARLQLSQRCKEWWQADFTVGLSGGSYWTPHVSYAKNKSVDRLLRQSSMINFKLFGIAKLIPLEAYKFSI